MTTIETKMATDKLFVKVDKGYDVSLKVADAVKAIKKSSVNGGDVKLIVEVPVETISGSYDAASVSLIGGYDSEKKAYIFVDENKTEYIFTDIKLALNQFANDILGDAVTVKLAEQTGDTPDKVMQQELFGVIVDETPRHVEITMHGNETPLFSITVDGKAIYNGKANWSQKNVDEWVMNAYENRAQYPNMTIEVPEVVAALYLNSFACHPNIVRELNVTLTAGITEEERAAIDEYENFFAEATAEEREKMLNRYTSIPLVGTEAQDVATDAEIEMANYEVDEFDYVEAAEHIKSVYDDVQMFIGICAERDGLTQEQSEQIYIALHINNDFMNIDCDLRDKLIAQYKEINAVEAEKNELPTGDITVESGAEAFALIAKYFPTGLKFDGIDYFYGTHFCYFNGDSYMSAVATCDKENRRIEYVQVVDHKQNGMGLEKHYPLTVHIEPKKNEEADVEDYAVNPEAQEIAIDAEVKLSNTVAAVVATGAAKTTIRTIETKKAKNGAKLYYVDGKRVSKAAAMEVAANNDCEIMSNLFEQATDAENVTASICTEIKTVFEEPIIHNFFFNSVEKAIDAANKILATFVGRVKKLRLDDNGGFGHSKVYAYATRGNLAFTDAYKNLISTEEQEVVANAENQFPAETYMQWEIDKLNCGNGLNGSPQSCFVVSAEKFIEDRHETIYPATSSLDFNLAEKARDIYRKYGFEADITFFDESEYSYTTIYYMPETDGTEEDDDENIWNFIPDIEELNDVEFEQVEKEGCAAKSEHDGFSDHETKDLRGGLLTGEPPIVGNSSSEKICDSLFRAMKIALEKIQEYCREVNVSAAINEMKLYSICRAALPDRRKAG